jgi:apolipoprotein N-acyltransferase
MDSTEAPPSARTDIRTGLKYDWFNAAAYLQPGADTAAWYGKMKMVPFAERIPYADLFTFVDFLRWDVGIGGWQIGPDTTVFRDMRTGSRFAPLICYESTYPGFVSAFVRRGAELLVILTIDSWWGRMSGAFQHQRFAVFRAVENRRWVARCAVGGISCYIDPWGRVHDATELFTRAVLTRTITARRELTFYTQHGDFLGEACLTFAMLIAAAIAGKRFLRKQREQLWQSG